MPFPTRLPIYALQAFVARYHTQKAAAKALGVSQPYLHDLLRRRRTFSIRILKKLGLRRTVEEIGHNKTTKNGAQSI